MPRISSGKWRGSWMKFWNDIAIDRSFRIMQELRRELNFV